jgi:hypothetical protein
MEDDKIALVKERILDKEKRECKDLAFKNLNQHAGMWY